MSGRGAGWSLASARGAAGTALAGVLLCLFLAAVAAAPTFPVLTGRVMDDAGLLTADDEQLLNEELAALEEKSTDQVVVYTAPSLQGYPIEDFGYQLGRAWGIGQKGKDNGVLLIVAPKERKVRIEVGRRLEPLLTDLMSKLIIENTILPAFRRGDFGGGIKAGVHDIRDVLLGDAEAVKERARGGTKRSNEIDPAAIFFILLFIGVFAFTAWRSAQQARNLPANARRRRGDNAPIFIPGGWGGSGGWDGGGGGGGGWSGGGGDFGGGGASGSW
ncbi:MAG: YgcG family protein [Hyphomicrobiaceae bacterium]